MRKPVSLSVMSHASEILFKHRQQTMKKSRSSLLLAAAIIATIALGLASRKCPALFPAIFEKYPGDALWAQMVYWLVAFVSPAASVVKVALTALVISYADECSQLYQAPWINAIRATTPGHLVLGSAFSWGDIVAYTVGIALVAPLDAWWFGRGR